MTDRFPRRKYPCGPCPWKRSTPPGEFTAERYDALRSTSDQTGLSAPMFGCHKGEPGTDADLACAGWLAVAGYEHIGIRLALSRGDLPVEALSPGDGWPDLFGSYDEMAQTQGATS